jgi:hypothetical protein
MRHVLDSGVLNVTTSLCMSVGVMEDYKNIFNMVLEFFADSGVQLAQHDRGLFHFRRAAEVEAAKSNSRQHHTYSPITHANISSINLVSIFRCSNPPRNPVGIFLPLQNGASVT